MKTYEAKQTKWQGLWWSPETNSFKSSSISLSTLREFKGNVKLIIRKNKFFNGGQNNRPNYMFTIRDCGADKVHDILVQDDADVEDVIDTVQQQYGVRLYTQDQVRQVMHGAMRDARSGYDEYDCLIQDYL